MNLVCMIFYICLVLFKSVVYIEGQTINFFFQLFNKLDKRIKSWLKVKKDYIDGIGDSLDVVVNKHIFDIVS